jgi:hypothetical protein
MKNGLLYLLVGGVIGYLGYSYYLKQQKQKGKQPSKSSKKDEEMLKEEVSLPEDMILVQPTPVVKKPIFDPRIARDYNINKQPAQPHLVIYKGVSAPKEELKISDFVVNKKEPEINYSWLM